MRNLLLALFLTLPLSAQVPNDLVIPRAAAPRIFVPIAGNTAGANGTFFRSDINVVNLRGTSQLVDLYWMPFAAPGSPAPIGRLEIPAQRGVSSEDFVDDVLRQAGLGGIEFVGVNANGTFDSSALLHVTSRVWTPRPDGGEGTMSQTLPALVAGGQAFASTKVVFGMRRSAQYRLNAGVMNPTSATVRFRITAAISSATGVDTQVLEFDVPARAIRQEVVPGTSAGIAQILIEVLTPGGAGDWQGWASSIDNQSGDAWSQIAVGG